MNLELTNKHVLITGGSKGIGLACARTFLAEGARVTLVSRSMENLLAAQSALLKETPVATANVIAADLRDAAEAERAVDAVERDFGAVDVIVTAPVPPSAHPPTSSLPPRGTTRCRPNSSSTSTSSTR